MGSVRERLNLARGRRHKRGLDADPEPLGILVEVIRLDNSGLTGRRCRRQSQRPPVSVTCCISMIMELALN